MVPARIVVRPRASTVRRAAAAAPPAVSVWIVDAVGGLVAVPRTARPLRSTTIADLSAFRPVIGDTGPAGDGSGAPGPPPGGGLVTGGRLRLIRTVSLSGVLLVSVEWRSDDDDVGVVIAVEVAHVEGDLGLAADDAHVHGAAEGPVPVAPVQRDAALARGDHRVEPAVTVEVGEPAGLVLEAERVRLDRLGVRRDAGRPVDEQVEVPAVLVADEDVHVAVGLDVADIDEVRLARARRALDARSRTVNNGPGPLIGARL